MGGPRLATDEERKEHIKASSRAWCKRNPEKVKAKVKKWHDTNPDKVRAYNSTYYSHNKVELNAKSRDYNASNRERLNLNARNSQRRLREKCLAAYGTKCECCGESRKEFLAIDHTNGGGNKHRREVGEGSAFYRWLRNNNFPPGFRILCHNCNMAIGFYGSCPHERETL